MKHQKDKIKPSAYAKLPRSVIEGVKKEIKQKRMNNNIIEASMCGTQAFKDGKKCIPALDQNLRNLIGRGRNNTEPCLYILKAWVNSWTVANLVAPI